jgi:hypothetical protein
MAEPIIPLKTAGLPPRERFPSGKWVTLPVQLPAPALQDIYIPASLPRLSCSFFTLLSKPPRPTPHPSLRPIIPSSLIPLTHSFCFAIALNHPFFAPCAQFSRSLSSAYGRHSFSQLQSFVQALCPLI